MWTPRLIVILIFGGISLILIGSMTVLVWRRVWVLRVGRRVRGQCVNVYVDQADLNPTHDRWYSTIAFTAPGGGRHRLTVETGQHTLGEWIPVLVPPGAPERARVDQPWLLWRAPIFLGLIVIVFVPASVALLLTS